MRPIGLHLRITHTLQELAQRAYELNLPLFQCFLIEQSTNAFISPSDQEIADFVTHWAPRFAVRVVHGSYWINLANSHNNNRIVARELELAKKLQFTHIVLHPGAMRTKNKKDGIITVARNLNMLLKNEHDIHIVLENTAHAGLCLGGDLHDFRTLREYLDYPEKVTFCIDTAHAYSYHYDIATQKGQEAFFEIVAHTIGFDAISLLHLNDTQQACGSRIDKHELVGAGKLGLMLKNFMGHPLLKKVPIILELPVTRPDTEKEILSLVQEWDTQP